MSFHSQEEARRVQAEVNSALALVLGRDFHPNTRDFLQHFYQKMAANNRVHPLFAWSSWTKLTRKEYLSLLPALGLASRLLTQPATANFINSMIYCPPTTKVDSKGKPRLQFRLLCTDPGQPLNGEAQKRYDEALLRLVSHVRLASHPLPETTLGRTYTGGVIERGSPGVKSRIELNQKHIDDIIPGSHSLPMLLLRYFELAVTLVHELMHAIGFALSGPETGERFLVGQNFVENGFAWEVLAMGGIVSLANKHNKFAVELHLKEINVPALADSYNRSGGLPVSFPGGPNGAFIRKISGLEVMAEFEELLAS